MVVVVVTSVVVSVVVVAHAASVAVATPAGESASELPLLPGLFDSTAVVILPELLALLPFSEAPLLPPAQPEKQIEPGSFYINLH